MDFMGRTKTPDGKREGWSVKLSKPKSDAADAMRGTMLRAHWLESLIDAALANGGTPPAPVTPEVSPERTRKPAARRPPPGPEPPRESWQPPFIEPAIQPIRPCRHPSALVEDNICGECRQEVDS